MKQHFFYTSGLLTLLFVGCISSCQKEMSTSTFHKQISSSILDAGDQAINTGSPVFSATSNAALLQAVQSATSRFHATTQATIAGYEPTEQCVAVPALGGMGYHWPNTGLVDNVFDPLQPEVLLYATGQGGKLQLVAVEYVVLNTGQTAPMFGDQPFTVGGAPVPVPHWTLHVWVHKHNPSGIFAPFNPDVTCP